jgi:hypothetical protein
MSSGEGNKGDEMTSGVHQDYDVWIEGMKISEGKDALGDGMCVSLLKINSLKSINLCKILHKS